MKLEVFSWKTTSHKGQMEVYYVLVRQTSTGHFWDVVIHENNSVMNAWLSC